MPARRRSRFTVSINSISASDKSMLAGSKSGPMGIGSKISRESTSLMRESYVVRSKSSGLGPEPDREAGLRIHVDQKDTIAQIHPSAAPKLAVVVVLATPPF